MKNKGFTLIELLAVIVILAIIALIAVPIVLNIINDAREQSNKRSVELYGKAVENAIAKAQLKGDEIPSGELSDVVLSTNESFLSTVKYEGNRVECTTNMLYEDGKIYMSGCSIGGHTVNYTYGKSQYAYLTFTGSYVEGPSIGGDASSLPTSAPDANYYLKFKLDNDNKVIKSEACAIFDGEEYCLEGGSINYYGWNTDAAHSIGNVAKLYKIQSANIEGVSCTFTSGYSECSDGSVYLIAGSNGDAAVGVSYGDVDCRVSTSSSICASL